MPIHINPRLMVETRILNFIRQRGMPQDLVHKWETTLNSGYFELEAEDSVAVPIFKGLQTIIEKSIAEGIKRNEISRAFSVLHGEVPAPELSSLELNKLSADFRGNDDFAKAIKAFEENPDLLSHSPDYFRDMRAKVLREFITVGGVVTSAYQRETQLTEAYNKNLGALAPRLVDRPLDSSVPTGAVIEFSENTDMASTLEGFAPFFSLQVSPVDKEAEPASNSEPIDKRRWQMWYERGGWGEDDDDLTNLRNPLVRKMELRSSEIPDLGRFPYNQIASECKRLSREALSVLATKHAEALIELNRDN